MLSHGAGPDRDGTDERRMTSRLEALGASTSAHTDLGLVLPPEQQ